LATKENTINCGGKWKSLAIPLEELSELTTGPVKIRAALPWQRRSYTNEIGN
jgi:hypothetical protein